jgi:hypothetical protein
MAAVAMAVARMPADELAHPLDHGQVDSLEVDGGGVDSLADAQAPGPAPSPSSAPTEASGPARPGPQQRGVT